MDSWIGLMARGQHNVSWPFSEPDVSLHAWLLQADISRDAGGKGVL